MRTRLRATPCACEKLGALVAVTAWWRAAPCQSGRGSSDRGLAAVPTTDPFPRRQPQSESYDYQGEADNHVNGAAGVVWIAEHDGHTKSDEQSGDDEHDEPDCAFHLQSFRESTRQTFLVRGLDLRKAPQFARFLKKSIATTRLSGQRSNGVTSIASRASCASSARSRTAFSSRRRPRAAVDVSPCLLGHQKRLRRCRDDSTRASSSTARVVRISTCGTGANATGSRLASRRACGCAPRRGKPAPPVRGRTTSVTRTRAGRSPPAFPPTTSAATWGRACECST